MKRIAAFTLCAATAAGVSLVAQEGPSSVAVPVVWVGHDSKVDTANVERITTERRWAEVWTAHTGKDLSKNVNRGLPNEIYRFTNDLQLPQVNFDTHMVVAIFGGKDQTSAGYQVADAKEHRDRLQIRVNHRPFGSHGKPPTYTPYGFFVLPRSSKPIQLERNFQNVKADPPEWRVWKTLSR